MVVNSKYLIEQQSFFSKQHLVISLMEDQVLIYPLINGDSNDGKNSTGNVIRYYWYQVLGASPSDKNEKDFTLSILPQSGNQSNANSSFSQGTFKRQQTQVTSIANSQQTVYSCSERERLITEITQKLQQHYRPQVGYFLLKDKCIYQPTQNSSKQAFALVQMRIHPTTIQLTQMVIPEAKPQNQKQPNLKDLQPEEELKFDRNLIQEEVEQCSPSVIDQDNMANLIRRSRQLSNNLSRRVTTTNNNNEGKKIQVYKDNTGDNLLIMGPQSEKEKREETNNNQSQFIYMSDIVRIRRFDEKIVIEQKDSESETLIFASAEKCQVVEKKIVDNALEYIRKRINQENSIIKPINPPRKIIRNQEAIIVKWGNIVTKVRIDLDERYIYEIDLSNGLVNKRLDMTDISFLKISESLSQLPHSFLMIGFKSEAELCLILPTSYQRDELLSAILTLRSQIIPQTNYLDHITYLVNSQDLDFSLRILGKSVSNQGYVQQTKHQHQIDYEGMLLRRLANDLTTNTQSRTIQLIEEIILNASMVQLYKIDQLLAKNIMNQIRFTLDQYYSENFADISSDFNRKNLDLITQKSDMTVQTTHKNELFDKVVKMLNVLSILLNSKLFFTEVFEQPDLAQHLLRLTFKTESDSQTISQDQTHLLKLLASQALKKMIQHYTGTESRQESLNKRLLVYGSVSQIGGETSSSKRSSSAKGEYDTLKLFNLLKSFIEQVDSENDFVIKEEQQMKPCLIGVYSVAAVINSIIGSRIASTGKEELKILADIVTEDDTKFKELLQNEGSLISKGLRNLEDPMQNKPVFHMLDRLIKLGDKFFEAKLFFSSILSECFDYLRRYDADQLFQFQTYALIFSVNFLKTLSDLLTSNNSHQVLVCVKLLSNLLSGNQNTHSLLLRCFPQFLLSKVATQLDPQNYNWTYQEWKSFFSDVIYRKYVEKATEHWDEVTLQELTQQVCDEIKSFYEAQKLHTRIVRQQGLSEGLKLPNHEYSKDRKVVSRYQNIRWNSLEFLVKYESLKEKCLIGDYYLTKLIVETNLTETQRPYFSLQIERSSSFFEDLKLAFMTSFDKQERLLILKAMIILYRYQFKFIGEINCYAYIMQMFSKEDCENMYFYLLQFLQVSLSIDDAKLAKKNRKKFIKHQGLEVVFDQIKMAFIQKPLVQQDLINYTLSKTCNTYFKENTSHISTCILVIKILDVLFQEQQSIDQVPLPPNREFILQPTSLAILTQLLTLQNDDLTRELTLFILTHLNNHYFFYLLKDFGMIELLIKTLSSQRNSQRVLKLLERFQEVCFDYNSGGDVKLGNFSSNDSSILLANKEQNQKLVSLVTGNNRRQTKILSESIFLRFFPLALIQYFYEQGEEKFLEVYRSESFSSTILIWNAEMRHILEKAIDDHFQKIIANNQRGEPSLTESEIFQQVHCKKFNEIIKYPMIEHEVRCGRYYLRVWVNQSQDAADFFDIPEDQEEEFHRNLQDELKNMIYQEKQDKKERVIILFKSCVLALKRFKNKRLACKDEIKSIILEICRKMSQIREDTIILEQNYGPVEKEIVYLGIKAMYKFIQSNLTDLKEILTKIGIEIISEIFELLITQSLTKNYNLTLIEIKTLNLCFKYFNEILNKDIQALNDFESSQRIKLFSQISIIMNMSLSLLPMLKDKELNQQLLIEIQQDVTEKQEGNIKEAVTTTALFDPVYQLTSDINKKGSLLQSKQQQYTKKIEKGEAEGPQQSQNLEIKKIKSKSMKDEEINYMIPAINILKNKMDRYLMEKFAKLFRSLAEFYKQLSKNPLMHSDFIISGIALKSLRFLYFQLKSESSQFKDIKVSVRLTTVALKNLISFASSIDKQGKDTFGLKKISQEEENLIKSFWIAINRLFCKKMIAKLIQEFQIINNELRFQNQYNPKIFLQNFQTKSEVTSELVWDDESRAELRNLLDTQIEQGRNTFLDIEQFQYSIAIRELQVNNIFIRFYNNSEDRFSPLKPQEFGIQIINKLRQYMQSGLNSINEQNCIQLVIALKNLLMREKDYSINNKETFDSFVDSICSIVKLSEDGASNEALSTLSQATIEIIIYMIYKGGSYIHFLKNNREFINFLIRGMYCQERIVIDQKKIVQIVQMMISQKEISVEQFLNAEGIILLLLNLIFEQDSEVRIECLRILLHTSCNTDKIYGNFLPQKFFLEFFTNHMDVYKSQHLASGYLYVQQTAAVNSMSAKNKNQLGKIQSGNQQQNEYRNFETQYLKEFLTQKFDAKYFENVFVIWNDDLRLQSHQRIRNNCDEIVKFSLDSFYQPKKDISKMSNPLLESEIIVKDVIIRVFNKRPQVFIKEKLNSFILEICKYLQENVALKIFKLRSEINDNKTIIKNYTQKFKSLCQESNLLLTAMILSLEQLIFNDQNQNRMVNNKKAGDLYSNMESYVGFNRASVVGNVDKIKHLIEKTTDMTQLDQLIFQHLSFWIQQQIYKNYMPPQINISFLQVLYLILHTADSIEALLDNQSLLLFINYSILSIAEINKSNTPIEEFLILLILYKSIQKESRIIPQITAISTSTKPSPRQNENQNETTEALSVTSSPSNEFVTLDHLLKIFQNQLCKSSHSQALVEMILHTMSLNSQYGENVRQKMKIKKVNFKIIESKHEKLDVMIREMWRSIQITRRRPSLDGQQSIYEFSECQKIEDKLQETNMEKIRLPLISIDSIVKQEVNYFEEEEKQRESVQQNLRGNSMISRQTPKKNVLGYKPMLSELDDDEFQRFNDQEEFKER